MPEKIDFSKIRFLLVEPSSVAMDLTKDILGMLGAVAIRKCTDTDRAFEILRSDPVDIIITEWNTAPLSGLDFIDAIRNSATSTDRMIPIILLTAHSEYDYIVQARDSGITEFLAKPFTVELLHQRLVSVIAHPRPFVKTDDYFGPDRRRIRREWAGPERRLNQFRGSE